MNLVVIILAAGSSVRLGSNIPKQYQIFNGKALIRHSIDFFIRQAGIANVIIAINKDHTCYFEDILKCYPDMNLRYFFGGAERSLSVYNALNYIKENIGIVKNVMIHDGARPFMTKHIYDNLMIKIHQDNQLHGAFPAIKIVDAVKKINHHGVTQAVDRNELYYSQTPQIFNFDTLYRCFQNECNLNSNFLFCDEIELLEKYNYKTALIPGDKKNIKITYMEDFN